MENDIVWIKENETNNIYCCELGKACLNATDIVYDVNCIIGSFTNIMIPIYRTFKNPVNCTMLKNVNIMNLIAKQVISTGMACYDIEKLYSNFFTRCIYTIYVIIIIH